jgi:hypothetical protein
MRHLAIIVGQVNLLDPGFLGGVAAAIAALLGAMIGGFATYQAATGQFRHEYNARKWDALRAVLIEIQVNQPALFRDLDRSLPAWLARCHRRGGLPLSEIGGYVRQTARYESTIYAALLGELVTTKFGSELVLYFSRISWLNAWTKSEHVIDVAQDFPTYIQMLANSLLLADELVPAIEKECRKSAMRVWGKNLDMETFARSRDRFRFAAELAKFDLQTIEEFLRTGKQPGFFPPILARSDPSGFDTYVIPAREISAW